MRLREDVRTAGILFSYASPSSAFDESRDRRRQNTKKAPELRSDALESHKWDSNPRPFRYE